MESWSYPAEERGYMISDGMDFSLEAFMRGKKALVEWDNKAKASCNFEKDEFSSDGGGFKSMEFVDLGFHGLFQHDIDRNYSKRVNSSNRVIATDSSLVEEESQSKDSCSLVESKSHNSSLIDLKLGRLADCKDAISDKFAKRARISSSPTQTPVCQVYGCNMDLSSSKEYHKRHKVCDAHSKTAKVIVNGIEQRFCQQCSRFHLLAEFDEGKRSCRRRLAGHNERRRKPQFDYMSGKPYKMLQLHQGTKYLEASLQKRTQFTFQDMIGSSIFHSGKYEQTNLSEHILHGQEKLSRDSNTACALSLLSVQSQDLSCHLAGNQVANSLVLNGVCANHSDEQVSKVPLGVNSVDNYAQNESSSRGVNSMEVIKNGSIMLSDVDRAPHFQVCRDNMYQTSDLINVKHLLSTEDGPTVDLFQLSSHLQRVEHQRNSFLQ